MNDPSAVDPETRRRARRPWLLTLAAVAGSAVLLVGAWLVDARRSETPRGGRARTGPVAELVTPPPLTEKERKGGGSGLGSQESVKLEQGAWVQVADAKGNLKQQYKSARIDPLPDKRFTMQQPRAILYGDGGRVVTMRADTMTARVPKRSLESGRMEGNVVIRIYNARQGRAVDVEQDAPDVLVETPEAQFDMDSGEIRCDRQVKITGDALSFEGEGLSLTLSQDGKGLERLVVDRPLAPVRFSRNAAMIRDAQRKQAAPAPESNAGATPAAPAAAPPPAAAAPAAAAASSAPAPAPAAAATPPAPAPAPAPKAGAPAKGGKNGAKPAAPKEGRLFQLTLEEQVVVTSVDAGRTTVIRGDRLQAFFMMRSSGAAGLVEGSPAPAPWDAPDAPVAVAAAGGPPAVQLAAAAVALDPVDDPSADDTVEVRYAGRLVLAPAPEGSPALAQPRDVRVIVTGAPAQVEDSKTQAQISALRIDFESGVERMALEGTPDAPAAIESPKFTLHSAKFALDRTTGKGACEAPGTLWMGTAGGRAVTVSWDRRMAVELAPISAPTQPGAARTPGAPGAAGEGSLRRAEFEGGVAVRSPDFDMNSGSLVVEAAPVGKKDCPRRIVAGGGVQIAQLGKGAGGTFAAKEVEVTLEPDAQGDPQPRRVLARGDVHADNLGKTGGKFEAQVLDVALAPNDAGEAQPRTVLASGGVRASGLGSTQGSFAAKELEVALSPNAQGQAQARTLRATGDVMAADQSQAIWASTLRIAFADAAPRARKAAPKSAGDDSTPGPEVAMADIARVEAEGPVEVRMQDGGRIFASRMEAEPAKRWARLVGPEVMIVRNNLVLDQLAEVRVQDSPVKVSALGPGRASAFASSVQPTGTGRLGRLTFSVLPQMQATWRDALGYSETPESAGGEGTGVLLLQGGVKVRGSRDAREAEALDADEVQVDLLGRGMGRALAQSGGTAEGAAAPKPKSAAPRSGDPVQQVAGMRATGNVRLEARQWADAARSGEPKLFRMNCPNITYTGADGSIEVDGEGRLLVHQPVVAQPQERTAGASPFSPDGTTRFTWKRSLSLARRPDGTSQITLQREVLMEHLGATDTAPSTGTVTADRMVATVRGAAESAPKPGEQVGLSLGGPAELVKLMADGRVIVRTPNVDVDAGEFELDVPTQVGAVRSVVGGMVTVKQQGAPAPMRAHAFTWDLVKGTFHIEGARGTLGR